MFLDSRDHIDRILRHGYTSLQSFGQRQWQSQKCGTLFASGTGIYTTTFCPCFVSFSHQTLIDLFIFAFLTQMMQALRVPFMSGQPDAQNGQNGQLPHPNSMDDLKLLVEI